MRSRHGSTAVHQNSQHLALALVEVDSLSLLPSEDLLVGSLGHGGLQLTEVVRLIKGEMLDGELSLSVCVLHYRVLSNIIIMKLSDCFYITMYEI
jgi:hypothetical protein